MNVLIRVLLIKALLASLPIAAEEFLDVDVAFRLHAVPAADGTVAVTFGIAPGYHLYRERLSFTPGAGLSAGDVDLPKGRIVHDANFDRDMEIYEGRLALSVPLQGAAAEGLLTVGYQGCADGGLCYPPQTRTLRVSFASPGKASAVALADAVTPAPASVSVPALAPTTAADSGIAGALRSGHLLTIVGVFLLAGVLLSFTPCVLPMVPILSAIIVGDAGPKSRARGFALALSYALGMALVYTLFGVAAGLLGEGLAARLQNPWVLGAFALAMAGLALSMFDVYQLQMPSFIQSRLTQASGSLKGGSYAAVFVMGGVSALIVGPCVAAPLAGALVYISQTRDVVAGGAALFALACGMSVPLLLVGLSAGTLLPKAGRWMESVKTTMGMLMLAVAWWLVSAVLPAAASLLIVAAWLALAATLLGAFQPLAQEATLRPALAKSAGLLLAVIAVAQVAGALSGAASPWQPLAPFTQRASASAAEPGALAFRRVESPAQLDAAIAGASGRMVMVDVYADWCVACKELEHETFADAGVRARLKDMLLLQADVTANNVAQRALLKRYGLFGPPGVLFFDGAGRELASRRVVGFEKPEPFLANLAAAEQCVVAASEAKTASC